MPTRIANVLGKIYIKINEKTDLSVSILFSLDSVQEHCISCSQDVNALLQHIFICLCYLEYISFNNYLHSISRISNLQQYKPHNDLYHRNWKICDSRGKDLEYMINQPKLASLRKLKITSHNMSTKPARPRIALRLIVRKFSDPIVQKKH